MAQYLAMYPKIDSVCVCVHITAVQQSPILAGASLVWNQWGVQGWKRSFKQMWCSLSVSLVFLLRLFLITSYSWLSWHDCYVTLPTGGRQNQEKTRSWKPPGNHLQPISGLRQIHSRLLFPFWPWGTERVIHSMKHSVAHTHDNTFRNRWLNENHCFSAEEEQAPF